MSHPKSPFSLAVLPDGRQVLTDRVSGIATIHAPGTHPTDPEVTNIVVTQLREPKDTVIRARVPSELAERLHSAGASAGTGASAVLRQLLERGLADFEAADALKVPAGERREHFIQTRLDRKAKRAAAKRK